MPQIELSDYCEVLFQAEDKLVTLTMNRPESMNAMTMRMAEELVAAVDHVADLVRSDAVRVLVVTGAGERAFSSGADLKERRTMSTEQLWIHGDLIRQSIRKMNQLPVPVIVAIRGYCLGGGMEMAVGCDLRVAAEDARLGFTEARLAAFPGAGGAVFTPRLIPIGKARELLYTGCQVDGREAERIGLVERAVPAERVLAEAQGLAREIANNGPLAIRALKQLLNHGPQMTVDDAFALSDALRKPLNATHDYAEALAAFAEKRKPVFRGE